MKVTKEIKDKIDHIIKTFAKGNTTIVFCWTRSKGFCW